MNSRLRRIVTLFFTLNLLPTLVRLIFISVFGYFVFIDEGMQFAAFKTHDTVSFDENGKIVNFVLPISNAITARLAISIIIFGLAFISLFRDWFRIFSEYQNKKRIPIKKTSIFLEERRASGKKFVFILRPFGVDGNLYLPINRGFWSRFFFPGSRTLTVEQLVAQQASYLVGVDTVSLVDPDRDILSPGPVYLASDSANWRDEVRALLACASGVLFVFPPSCKMSEGVSWEFETVSELGEISKVAAVFPSAQNKTSATHDIIEHLLQYLPIGTLEVEGGLKDIFFLNFRSGDCVWKEVYKNWLIFAFGRAHTDIYEQAIEDWISGLDVSAPIKSNFQITM